MSRPYLIQVYNNTKLISERYPKPEKSLKIKYDNLNINISNLKRCAF